MDYLYGWLGVCICGLLAARIERGFWFTKGTKETDQ